MTSDHYQGNIIWIIGASSGIGKALAHELAKRGAILALSARRQEELDLLCQSLGEQHKSFPLDVRNSLRITSTALEIYNSYGRIDRVIFLAAAYTPMELGVMNMELVRNMIEVNLLGAFHTVYSILPVFNKQKTGQLALCGSIAGYNGLPGGQPYSATKAAIINLAESLRNETEAYIDVKLINPGFVKTPLTDKNNFAMPAILSAEQAAVRIADGLLSQDFEVCFPRKLVWLLKLMRLLPYGIALPLIKSVTKTKKPSQERL